MVILLHCPFFSSACARVKTVFKHFQITLSEECVGASLKTREAKLTTVNTLVFEIRLLFGELLFDIV